MPGCVESRNQSCSQYLDGIHIRWGRIQLCCSQLDSAVGIPQEMDTSISLNSFPNLRIHQGMHCSKECAWGFPGNDGKPLKTNPISHLCCSSALPL